MLYEFYFLRVSLFIVINNPSISYIQSVLLPAQYSETKAWMLKMEYYIHILNIYTARVSTLWYLLKDANYNKPNLCLA